MDITTRRKAARLWSRARWVIWIVFALGFFSAVAWLALPSTRSRWTLEERGSWSIFREKIVPAAKAEAFRRDYPGQALAWFDGLGLKLPDPRQGELFTFAAWRGYSGLALDDRLLRKTLKGRDSPGLRLAAMLGPEIRLNEAVASCFVTPDGRYLFLDLDGDSAQAAIHGLAHVLARSHVPENVRASLDQTKASTYDPKSLRTFSFLEETAALFLSDLWSSGATGLSPAELEKYAAYVEARYSPTGPIFTDEGLSFTFGSDPRTPRAFAASARFMLAAARARGLPAVAAWSASFLSGAYPSLEASTLALGGDLPALLGLWLGDRNIPE